MNTVIDGLFSQLGFSETEGHIYTSLLSLGKCRAGKLIKETGLHRNIVYTTLEKLTGQHLVSKTTQGRVAIFEANDPQTLVENITQKRTIAEQLAQKLHASQHQSPRDIKIFEGIKGILAARERSLDLPAGETVFIFGGSQTATTPEFQNAWTQYHRARLKKGVLCKMLFDHTVSADFIASRNAMPHTEARYAPFNFALPAWFEMYGNILSIGVPGDEPVMFSIRSREAVESMKNYFEFLWKQSGDKK